MASENSKFAGSAAVMAAVKHAAKTEGSGQLRDANLQLSSVVVPPEAAVRDHWMSLILLAGGGIRMTLKAFYNTNLCRRVLADVTGQKPEEIADHYVSDLMRELLNRVGGSAKRMLGDAGLTVGLSLPLVTRGFDQIFSNSTSQRDTDFEHWVLSTKYGAVAMSAELTLAPADCLNKFEWVVPAPKADADDGELDFL